MFSIQDTFELHSAPTETFGPVNVPWLNETFCSLESSTGTRGQCILFTPSESLCAQLPDSLHTIGSEVLHSYHLDSCMPSRPAGGTLQATCSCFGRVYAQQDHRMLLLHMEKMATRDTLRKRIVLSHSTAFTPPFWSWSMAISKAITRTPQPLSKDAAPGSCIRCVSATSQPSALRYSTAVADKRKCLLLNPGGACCLQPHRESADRTSRPPIRPNSKCNKLAIPAHCSLLMFAAGQAMSPVTPWAAFLEARSASSKQAASW